MVIESEIKPEKIERRGRVGSPNAGRKPNFPDVEATRKSILLPDDVWEKLHKMYPDSSASMLFYRFIMDNDKQIVAS